MPAAQRHAHPVLRVHAGRCAPVDFIRTDHATSTAGQRVGNEQCEREA